MKIVRASSKPIQVEAILFDGSNECALEIEKWSHGEIKARWKDERVIYLAIVSIKTHPIIRIGDWAVKSPQGMFSPFSPYSFSTLYDIQGESQ